MTFGSSEQPAEVPSPALVELVREKRGHMSAYQRAEGVESLVARWTWDRRRTWLRPDSPRLWAMAAAIATVTAIVSVVAVQWNASRALSYAIDGGRVERSGAITALAGEPPRLRFSDGTEVRLGPATKASLCSVDGHGARLSLTEGSARVDVMHVRGARWLFEAGPFQIAVTGTVFTVEWSQSDEQLDVRMQRGSVQVTGPLSSDATLLGAGQHLTARLRQRETLIRSLEDETAASPAPVHARDSRAAEPGTAAATNWAPDADAARPVARVASEPKPASGSHTHASTGIGDLDWKGQLASGGFEMIVRQAEHIGIDKCLAEASSTDLAVFADAARFGRHDEIARRALLAQRRRFPLSEAARDASFLLGRLDETEQHGADAVEWYDRYLSEAAAGTYASEALGRKMNLVERSYGEERARDIAKDYAARFPQGAYAARARALTRMP